MATILSFLAGRQITNDNGVPQSGALLYHYQAGTLSNLTVYSDSAGTVPHTQPVACDSGGFVPLIYIGDASEWKVIIRTSGGVELQTYDDLPAAEAAIAASNFASPQFQWNQVTGASSPVTLAATDVGKAYEANTTAGSIEFDLPSAAAVGNGRGFVFKKTSASNTLTIDPNGTETIDDIATSLAYTAKDIAIGIYSNGAEWYSVFGAFQTYPTVQRFTSGSGTYTPPANCRAIRVRMVGGGGGGGAAATNNGSNGGDTSFGSWTAIHGNGGGVASAGLGGSGGTGGATGTGTLLARFDGQGGYNAVAATSANTSGSGGSSYFGGGAIMATGGAGSATGLAAKANTGSGGSGGSASGTGNGGGGGAGEYVEFFVSPPASASYAVGAGGAGGTAGTQAGGAGAAGIIIVEEYY